MSKLVLVGTIFAVCLATVMVSVVGVIADTADQDVEVNVTPVISVAISPALIDFGSVTPGTNNHPAVSDDIALDAQGSNVDLTIQIAVNGVPFKEGLFLKGDLADGRSLGMSCIEDPVSHTCSYDVVTLKPTLNVPLNLRAGVLSGVVTYTIMGPTP